MSHSETDNAAPSDTQMDVSSSTTPLKTSTGNRRRLRQQQAIDILEGHFRQVNQCPSLMEKEALLEKIKAVPGCCDYDLARLSGWFSNRRQRLRAKERKEHGLNVDHLDSRFPSLTPSAIQYLTVLASDQLHPSSELLKTWTTLLASSGAIEQDVINWIYHRNQQKHPLQQHTFKLHTPAPSDATTSPEPSTISQSQSQKSTFQPYKQETASSLVIPALPLVHPDEDETPSRATPSEPSPISPIISNNELNQRIIHGVRDALASPQTMSNAAPPPPKTAAEFEALFSPFEKQILLLLHTLEST